MGQSLAGHPDQRIGPVTSYVCGGLPKHDAAQPQIPRIFELAPEGPRTVIADPQVAVVKIGSLGRLVPAFRPRVVPHQSSHRAVIVEAGFDRQRARPDTGGRTKRNRTCDALPAVAVSGNSQGDFRRGNTCCEIPAHGLVRVVARIRIHRAPEQWRIVPGLRRDPPAVEIVSHQIDQIELRGQRGKIDPLEFVKTRRHRRRDFVAFTVRGRLRVEFRADGPREQGIILTVFRAHVAVHIGGHHRILPVEVHPIEAILQTEGADRGGEFGAGRGRRRDVGKAPGIKPAPHSDEHPQVRVGRFEPRIRTEISAHRGIPTVGTDRALEVGPRIDDRHFTLRRDPRKGMDHMGQPLGRKSLHFVAFFVNSPAGEVGDHTLAQRRTGRGRHHRITRRHLDPGFVTSVGGLITITGVAAAAHLAAAGCRPIDHDILRSRRRIAIDLQAEGHTSARGNFPRPSLRSESVSGAHAPRQDGAPPIDKLALEIEGKAPAVDRSAAHVAERDIGHVATLPGIHHRESGLKITIRTAVAFVERLTARPRRLLRLGLVDRAGGHGPAAITVVRAENHITHGKKHLPRGINALPNSQDDMASFALRKNAIPNVIVALQVRILRSGQSFEIRPGQSGSRIPVRLGDESPEVAGRMRGGGVVNKSIRPGLNRGGRPIRTDQIKPGILGPAAAGQLSVRHIGLPFIVWQITRDLVPIVKRLRPIDGQSGTRRIVLRGLRVIEKNPVNTAHRIEHRTVGPHRLRGAAAQ